MRYIADSDGYVKEVSFGADIVCEDQVCTEYTGEVPTGYASLEAWFMEELEKLYRWKIVGGNLTLDSSAVAPREKTPEEILAELGGISEKVLFDNASPTSSFPKQTLDDELADIPGNYDEVEITMATYDLSGASNGTGYKIKVGESARLLIFGKHIHYRDVTVNATNIVFDTPYIAWNMDGKFVANDVVNAPARIKGIKGVR